MTSGVSSVPAEVRFQAENMFAVMPEPPRELSVELIRNERYCLFVSPMPSMNMVERIRVEADDLRFTVDEICELLRSRGRTQAAWSIDSGATRAGLEESLLALGMVPYDEPPLEPSTAAMAIVTPPAISVSPGIEAREVQDHEEVNKFIDLEGTAHGPSSEDADAMGAVVHKMLDLRLRGEGTMRFYLATRDGEPGVYSRSRVR